MPVTINDIAKKAGVSLATVSRVLNDSGYVKQETREKILSVIKELNYTPSAIARSLSTSKTNTIGVIVPEISNPFFGEVIKGISDVADENGLNIILFDSNESMEKEIKALKVLKEQRIQGILIASTSVEDKFNSEYIVTIETMGIPIVLVDGHVTHANFSGVFVDNIKGAYEGTEALIKAGHKKIGVITGRMNSIPAQDRLLGYKKALTINNIPINEKYILTGNYKLETAYKKMKELIRMEDRPTAVFACSNMMTIGCIKALQEEKLKIPEDMAILGFDKNDVLDMLGMNISNVAGPTIELGRASMEMLIEYLNHKHSKELRRITLLPELVLKGSERYIPKK